MKNEGKPLISKWLGGEPPIPPEFVAAMQKKVVEYPVPNETEPTPLAIDIAGYDIVESSVQTNRLDERVLRVIYKFTGTITLLGANVNSDGLAVQVTRKLYPTGTPPTLPTLTTDVAIRDLGNGFSIEEISVEGFYNDEGVFIPSVNVDQPGQVYNSELDLVELFVDTTEALGDNIGDSNTEISPIDYRKAKVHTYDKTQIAEAYDNFYATFPATTSVELPDVLLGVSVVWEESESTGVGDETGSDTATGTNWTVGLNLNTSGQSSAGVFPEVIPTFRTSILNKISVLDYYFLLPNLVTTTQVLAKAKILTGDASLAFWPKFYPVEHTLVLRGQKASVRGTAAAKASLSTSDSGNNVLLGSGTGEDYDFVPSIRAVVLRPCIHGTVTLSGGTTNSKVATTSASADIGGFIDADTGTLTLTANGSVTPSSLSSTTPASIPSTGNFILNVDTELYKYGYCAVRVRILNAADL